MPPAGEESRDGGNGGDIRHGKAAFPTADRLRRHVQVFRQPFLRDAAFPAERFDHGSDIQCIHSIVPFFITPARTGVFGYYHSRFSVFCPVLFD